MYEYGVHYEYIYIQIRQLVTSVIIVMECNRCCRILVFHGPDVNRQKGSAYPEYAPQS